MGYFSNGTEGESYQARWCNTCQHDTNFGCYIWAIHLSRNYDECNNPDSILHALIPRNKDGGNGKCVMYISVKKGKA